MPLALAAQMEKLVIQARDFADEALDPKQLGTGVLHLDSSRTQSPQGNVKDSGLQTFSASCM
jgi:hypothetical protein